MELKKLVSGPIREVAKRVLFPVPTHLSKNVVQIDSAKLGLVEKSLRENYHVGWRGESKYSEEEFQADLHAHLYKRLEGDRREIIPWLDSATRLSGKRILEIGCGTGSSTIALAEQGAKVTGVDIDEGALLVAKDRARVYQQQIDFKMLNAEEVPAAFRGETFDMIIFFACLEHMTIPERLSSLKDAWGMLSSGGFIVVVDTPNRLWYFDNHTSYMPFFHWLPNELAFEYAKFSSRENFRELYNDYEPNSKEHFLRRGRGVSFHEFDISIGSTANLRVVSSLSTFQGVRHSLKRTNLDRRYKSVLRAIYPGIHEGFLDESLNVIIEKM